MANKAKTQIWFVRIVSIFKYKGNQLTLDEIFAECTNVQCMKREGLKAASYIEAMCKHAS